MKRMLIFAILVSTLLVLSGCGVDPSVLNQVNGGAPPVPPDGVIWSTQIGQMFYGMQAAVLEKVGTGVFTRTTAEGIKQIVFMWSTKSTWCFVGIDTSTMKSLNDMVQIGGANEVSPKTMHDLIAWLDSNGWSQISARDLPEVFKTTIAQLPALLMRWAGAWYTFVVFVPGLPADERINAIDLGGQGYSLDEFYSLFMLKSEEWH